MFLILDNYDQLDEGLQTGRLSAEVLNQLRHIIQHRQYITVLLSGRRRPEELSGATWWDYLIRAIYDSVYPPGGKRLAASLRPSARG